MEKRNERRVGTSALLGALAEALALALPVSCPGCGAYGLAVCDGCRTALAPALRQREVAGLPVHVGLRYEGVAAATMRALKQNGRTDLARMFAPAMHAALAAAMCDLNAAVVVPVPTSRRAFRARGYRVPDLLIRRAGAKGVRLLRPASPARSDQRALGRDERLRNVAGTMRAVRRASGRDAPVVIVDDVVTTGATTEEAVRVLCRAGFRVAAIAAVASTPRRG